MVCQGDGTVGAVRHVSTVLDSCRKLEYPRRFRSRMDHLLPTRRRRSIHRGPAASSPSTVVPVTPTPVSRALNPTGPRNARNGGALQVHDPNRRQGGDPPPTRSGSSSNLSYFSGLGVDPAFQATELHYPRHTHRSLRMLGPHHGEVAGVDSAEVRPTVCMLPSCSSSTTMSPRLSDRCAKTAERAPDRDTLATGCQGSAIPRIVPLAVRQSGVKNGNLRRRIRLRNRGGPSGA